MDRLWLKQSFFEVAVSYNESADVGLEAQAVLGYTLRDCRKVGLENKDIFFERHYDYVVDAIDMVSSKLSLIENSKKKNIRVISCMGAGNKLLADRLRVSDIFETYECPLAKVMRRELKRRGIKDVKVVWSDEKPINTGLEKENVRKAIPGSTSFVPPVAGMIIAGEVVRELVFGGE